MRKYIWGYFLKNKIFLGSYLLLFGASLIYLIWSCTPIELINEFTVTEPLSVINGFSMVLFVYFMFLSFELFAIDKNTTFHEVRYTTRNGRSGKTNFEILAILIVCILLIAALYLAFAFAMFFMCKHKLDMPTEANSYYWHILDNIIVNIVLTSIIAIIAGATLSTAKNKFMSYIMMLVISIIECGFLNKIAQYICVGESINTFDVINTFNFMPPNLNFLTNWAFGFSLLESRMAIIIFWLSLVIIIALIRIDFLHYRKKLKFAIVACCAVVCAFSFLQHILPESVVEMSYNPKGSTVYDQHYYLNNYDGRETEADFNITEYSLNLAIDRILEAEAKINVDKSNLPEYHFTLYHKFKVKKILDQNNRSIKFNQNGDYVTVFPDTDACLKSVTFYYSGFSNRYYSNRQGIFLPGSFCYYPIAGHVDIWKTDLVKFSNHDIKYNVLVDYKHGKIFSNLPGSGDKKNSFSGRCNGLTLMSGFLAEKKINGNRIIYEYLLGTADKTNLKKMSDILTSEGFGNATIFVVPCMNQDNIVLLNKEQIFTEYIINHKSSLQ